MNTPIIECHELTKCYDPAGRIGLKKIDLVLGRGKIIGLLGPNGSGKTTLIKLINGLLTPTSGEVFVDGDGIVRVGYGYASAHQGIVPDLGYRSVGGGAYRCILGRGDVKA